MTPTAGGVVFFGDMGGNFYALDTATGRKLWGEKIGGAIGGGRHKLFSRRAAKASRGHRPDGDSLADRHHDSKSCHPGIEPTLTVPLVAA
jgi:outer membrane protein assembly factor BamB